MEKSGGGSVVLSTGLKDKRENKDMMDEEEIDKDEMEEYGEDDDYELDTEDEDAINDEEDEEIARFSFK